ncbi:hypothetical protein GCM10023185_35630 [Hymenobacter saemangeumensis]|uniref:Outer membrane protein beta-barrel domain-containing protein n=1 Tax=Hymenobacter saemangeumensis TaxID=1084522 RepID=A0ABP8IPM2_9BACT
MLARVIWLLTYLLLITAQAQAQVYEPGWLVRSNGDTLRGEVENGFWIEAPTAIRFRRTSGSPSELYKPRQLRAVSFANGRYFRYEALPIDHAAETRPNMLTRGYAPDVRIDSVLSEVLVAGLGSLLRVVSSKSTHYFLSIPNKPILALAERLYYRQNKQGSWAVVDGNNFRNQLSLYFLDCPAAKQAAQLAGFTAPGLAAVVQAYNEGCSPVRQAGASWVALSSPERRVAWQGGVVAGLRFNSLPGNWAGTQPTAGCTDCTLRPTAGLYTEVFQPSRSAALYGEISVSRFSGQGLRLLTTGTGVFSAVSFDYNAWLTTARIGVRYFIPRPHDRQWLLSFTYESNWVSTPSITSPVPTRIPEQEDVYGFLTGTLLPSLGLGWRSHRLTLLAEGQMYRSHGEDISRHFIGSYYTLRLGMNYRLGRNPDQAAKRPARP